MENPRAEWVAGDKPVLEGEEECNYEFSLYRWQQAFGLVAL